MLNFFKRFRRDDDGAITVDWVVLTAAVVGFAVVVFAVVRGGAIETSQTVSTGLEQVPVGDNF